MHQMIPTEYWIYLATGTLAGVLSGMLGVGGGTIIVAILSAVFIQLGFSPLHIMHLAIGTSLATIVLTSISSARAHNRQHNVDWMLVLKIAPAIIIGALLGSALAAKLHSFWLSLIFAIFILVIATQLLLKNTKKSNSVKIDLSNDFMPHRQKYVFFAGLIIGSFSSLVGIGGGSLSVPYLMANKWDMRRAIGTSAAIGLPIALAGALGYLINGLHVAHLPSTSIGFIYLPALIGISLSSILTAPLGAKLAHKLPIPTLRKLFALLLYLVGVNMLWHLF